MTALDVEPAQEDVARGLHQMLAGHHPLAVIAELALAGELLEHRGLRLLELQEQRVLLVSAQHQHDPGTRADTADARPPCEQYRPSGTPRARFDDRFEATVDSPARARVSPSPVVQPRAQAPGRGHVRSTAGQTRSAARRRPSGSAWRRRSCCRACEPWQASCRGAWSSSSSSGFAAQPPVHRYPTANTTRPTPASPRTGAWPRGTPRPSPARSTCVPWS